MARLIQFTDTTGQRRVGLIEGDGERPAVLQQVESVYELAFQASREGKGLEEAARQRTSAEEADYKTIIREKRLLAPLDHPDPAHCFVTGTGLTHLGSAQSRDAMHAKLEKADAELSDSMKMFKSDLEGGKPPQGSIGVQPEWFYKGDGTIVVPPGHHLPFPGFSPDGGEEAEITGLYIVNDEGMPLRVGYALGNEFADHVTEKQNYLYLAHSKLRACSLGPELLIGKLPDDIHGTVCLLRQDREVWKGTFDSGEANMSHSLQNLEHHHFKYDLFRRPGDVHCHFFGAATLSFSAGVKAEPGDVFEIACPVFGRPLRNPLGKREDITLVSVRPL